MKKRLSTEQASVLLFALCWLMYSFSYIARLNYSAALAGMVLDGVFTKTQAGLIGSVAFFTYGAGQLINGILGDRLSPYRMVTAGLILSALSNLTMGFLRSYPAMAAVWGVNGFAQSMLWTPVLFLFSRVLPEEYRYKSCIHINTCTPAGTVMAYAFSLLVLRRHPWNGVFFMGAAALAFAGAVWVIGTGLVKKTLPIQPAIAKQEAGGPPPSTTETGTSREPRSLGGLLLTSGLLMLLFPVAISGMLKDGVVTWVPTMLAEAYTVPASFSLLLTILLPVVNLTGTYASSFVYKRFTKDEVKTAALFYAFALLPLFGLLGIGRISIYTSVLLLAVITTAVHAANTMTITLAPVRFGVYGKSAAVGGILNATVYLGSAVSTGVFGFLADAFGWGPTVCSWLVCTAAAVVLCIPAFLQWRRFCRAQ